MSNVTLVRPDRSVTLRPGNTRPISLSTQPRSVVVQRGGRIVAPQFSVNITIDGGNSTLEIGEKGLIAMPFKSRFTGYLATSEQNGTYTVELRKAPIASPAPPGPADAVTSFNVTGRKQSGNLNISCEAQDMIAIALTATDVVERISLTLFGERL